MSGFPLASENGNNFGFGYGGFATAVQVPYPNQTTPAMPIELREPNTASRRIRTGTRSVSTNVNPVVWLGTPDVQLMPTLVKGVSVKGGSHTHQFINPLGFGISEPGTNGAYRLPYLRGPAYMDHDLTVLKDFSVGEGKVLQLRMRRLSTSLTTRWFRSTTKHQNLNLGFQDGVVGQALTQSMLQYQDFGVANIKVGNRLAELEAKFTF